MPLPYHSFGLQEPPATPVALFFIKIKSLVSIAASKETGAIKTYESYSYRNRRVRMEIIELRHPYNKDVIPSEPVVLVLGFLTVCI